jgi:hypothetical protein
MPGIGAEVRREGGREGGRGEGTMEPVQGIGIGLPVSRL